MKYSVKVLLTIALAVCTWSMYAQKGVIVDYKESSARNLEPVHSVMVMPVIADMQVSGERIVYTETEMFKDYLVSTDVVNYITEFKKVALSRAAAAHKADAIIGATVDVVTNASGRLEITISGYPAKYTNFRNATNEDIDLVRQAESIDSANGNVLVAPNKEDVRKVQ